MRERRYAKVLITDTLMCRWLTDGFSCAVAVNGLPIDSELVDADFDSSGGYVCLVFWSAAFEALADGQDPPIFTPLFETPSDCGRKVYLDLSQ